MKLVLVEPADTKFHFKNEIGRVCTVGSLMPGYSVELQVAMITKIGPLYSLIPQLGCIFLHMQVLNIQQLLVEVMAKHKEKLIKEARQEAIDKFMAEQSDSEGMHFYTSEKFLLWFHTPSPGPP